MTRPLPHPALVADTYPIMVLLVDDQAMIGEAVRRALAPESDIEMHYCNSPAEAIEAAIRIRPTIILQDLVMPDIDGLTLLKQYRSTAATRDIPVVVLSTKEEPTVKREAFANGASDYLVKLPDSIELIARIRHHSRAYLNQLQRDAAYQALSESQQQLLEINLQLRSAYEERMAAQQALQQRNADLEELNRKLEGTQSQLLQSEKMASVGQLAAGVAHEINNPIGFVGSNINTLRDYVRELFLLIDTYEKEMQALRNAGATTNRVEGGMPIDFLREDIGNLLAESLDGIERVTKIIKDLKDFSHVDSAEWQWADLHEGLESTLNVVAHELRYKAEVVREYGQLPRVECLPFQLNQVFLNLLVNASQAIKERGTITLRTARDGDEVLIQVSDTGGGIDPAIMGRIFEPFFTTKPLGTGTGLGLSVSYGIIQRHHGTITVASTPGVGTTFTLRLPVRAVKDGADAARG